MARNDREASFSLVETEEEKQRAGQMPANAGRNFHKPGPRPIRPEVYKGRPRFSLRMPVWAWLALSFLLPMFATLLIHFKG